VRRWFACGARLAIVTALLFALAGIRWRRSIESTKVFFALDRSECVSSSQQEQSLRWLNEVVRDKPPTDRAGSLVFGAVLGLDAVLMVWARPSGSRSEPARNSRAYQRSIFPTYGLNPLRKGPQTFGKRREAAARPLF